MQTILSLAEFRQIFNQHFFAFFEQKKKQVAKIDPQCQLLVDEIIRFNQAGGKRIRPYISYLGFYLNEKQARLTSKKFNPVFFASELLESIALIHDDIMDEAKLRRGQETVYYRQGRDIAILAGDLIFSWMDEAMLNAGKLAQQTLAVLKQEIVLGQTLDLLKDKKEKLFSSLPDPEKILHIYKYKSAAYTVKRPLQIGYLAGLKVNKLSQKQQNDFNLLSEYGDKVGIGFQIIDDLIDLKPAQKTGKVQGGDIKEKKLTYWLVKLMAYLKNKHKLDLVKKLDRIYQQDEISKKDINWVISLVKQTGVLLDCQQQARTLIESGKQAIMKTSGSKAVKNKLIQIADFIIKRDY